MVMTFLNGVRELITSSLADAVFGDVMKNALDFVNDQQVQSRKLSDKFERGDTGVDVAQVMVAIQKASLSFQAATQVRNKLVSAYQDIMNMPL